MSALKARVSGVKEFEWMLDWSLMEHDESNGWGEGDSVCAATRAW